MPKNKRSLKRSTVSKKHLVMLMAVFSLLAVDWLTFHDFFEPHTLKDWLMLFSTITVFLYFAMDLSKKQD